MKEILKIKPKKLADAAFEAISEGITTGRFPPRGHLNEISLCTELGISRTPIREALFKLESHGFVTSSPNRGFFVSTPDPEIAANLYPILAALVALALKTSQDFPEDLIVKLKMIDRDLKAVKASSTLAFQLDLDFHETLTEVCPNSQLKDLLNTLYRQLRRYGGGKLTGKHMGYKTVIGALTVGDNGRAAAFMEQYWLKTAIQTPG